MRYTLELKRRNKHLEKIRYTCSLCGFEFESQHIAEHIINEFVFIDKKKLPETCMVEIKTMFDRGYKIDTTNFSDPKIYSDIVKLVRNNTKLKRTIRCDICKKDTFKSMKEVNKHKKTVRCY